MLRRAMLAAVVGGGSASDDFSSNTLANYTEYADSAGNWSISGGFLHATSGSQAILSPNGVTFSDGAVSAVFTQANNAGLVLRLTNNSNYYIVGINDNSGSPAAQVNLYKRVGGSYSFVATGDISAPRDTPFLMEFSATGTAFTVKCNGVTAITTTDSSHASGRCGIRVDGSALLKCDSLTWPA